MDNNKTKEAKYHHNKDERIMKFSNSAFLVAVLSHALLYPCGAAMGRSLRMENDELLPQDEEKMEKDGEGGDYGGTREGNKAARLGEKYASLDSTAAFNLSNGNEHHYGRGSSRGGGHAFDLPTVDKVDVVATATARLLGIQHSNAKKDQLALHDAEERRKLQTNTWTQRGGELLGEAYGGYVYRWNGVSFIKLAYPGDLFGYSVSLSSDGTVLAVGAPNNEWWTSTSNDGADNYGHVRVFQYANNTWTQRGGDIDGKTQFEESGTSVALSSNGNVLAVGAPASDAGRVRVHQYTSGSWTQLGSDLVGEAAQDGFGVSVALSSDGTVLAVGASGNDPSSGRTNAGHVHVYKFASGVWTQRGGDIDGEAANDNSGTSVSLSSNGNVLAVGASGNDPTSARTDAGHVRVYQFVNNAWTQQGGDIDGEAVGDLFGTSVSLSSDGIMLAVGASALSTLSSSKIGHVRVYKYVNDSGWIQLGSKISGISWAGGYGKSVSLSSNGSMLAIGEPYYSYYNPFPTTFLTRIGCVQVYRYANNAWALHGNDIVGEAAEDYSGFSVSLSSNGSVVAIGAPFNDIAGFTLPNFPAVTDGGHV